MLQKTYHITNFTDGSLEAALTEAASLDAYKSAAQVLLVVLEHNWDTEELDRHRRMVCELLPKAEVMGATHFDDLSPLWGEDTGVAHCAMFTFFFFEHPAFSLCRCPIDGLSDAEAGRALGDEICAMPDCKGAILLLSEVWRNADLILNSAGRGAAEGVPIFGATAARFTDSWGDNLGYVFDRDGVYSDTALLTLFHGETVRVKVSYNYGWTPVGKVMTITGMDDDFRVTEIDGQPAMDIYHRYLGLSPALIMVSNVCEFPLIVERNGLTIARVPVSSERGGRLRFGAALRPGERVRFSYGAQREIFSQVYQDASEYLNFAPQGMLLTVCGNRLIFLKDDEHYEVDYYRQLAPQLAVMHGNSELYQYAGTGGELNSALVAIGIREGEPENQELSLARKSFLADSASMNFHIPLAYRVMFFLSAVTADLKEMTERANAANEAKSAFLSNMSHEIRTPINAVLGMDEMILRESTEENVLEYAENIRTAGSSLLGLVNDILDFSKIEAGKMDILSAEYETASVLNDLVNLIQKRAEDKGLTLTIEADENLPAKLYGDELRIKQVVTNILTNAVKYTEEGGVTLHVNTEPSGTEGNVILCVSVQDTGIGIKKEDMQKLFSAFERIEEERNRSVEGTGLGMNITQRLLAMMGSKLEVQSVYGEGSTFSFRLEQRVVDATPMGDFSERLKQSLAARGRYRESFTAPEARILAVDDTPMNLTVLRGLLKKTAVRLDTAESGAECLDLITKNTYDLIFLDHRMPEMDGVETRKRMETLEGNRNASTPVIALTANAVSGAKEEYIALGFTDYLAKPIDAAALEKMVLQYLPPEKVKPASEEADTAQSTDVSDLPPVDGLDWGFASLHLPERELLETALRDFNAALLPQAEKLDGFYRAGTWEDYRILVHAMKSSAATVGIVPLAGLAKLLEFAARDGDTETVAALHAPFLREWRSYADKLQGVFGIGAEIEGAEPYDAQTVCELLEAVKTCMDDFDVDGADAAMERLKQIALPEAMRDGFEELKTAMLNVDSDGACRLADELLKEV